VDIDATAEDARAIRATRTTEPDPQELLGGPRWMPRHRSSACDASRKAIEVSARGAALRDADMAPPPADLALSQGGPDGLEPQGPLT
jgi:hypothetical protein